MSSVLVSTAVAIATGTLAVGPTVFINFPQEDARLPAVQADYVLGNVQPPGAELTINGARVKPHKEGGFLAFLPVEPGEFLFRAEAKLGDRTAVLERKIFVEPPLLDPATTVYTLDERSLQPAGDLDLREGDWVEVSARGPSGLTGTFRIYGVAKKLPLAETKPGLYEGGYQIQSGDKARKKTIRMVLRGPRGKIKRDLPGRLTILRGTPPVAVFDRDTYQLHNLRGAPGSGFRLFVPNGVKARVTGRRGREARVELSGIETGWVPAGNLRDLPPGTPLHRSVLGTIHCESRARTSILRMDMTERTPHAVRVRPGLFRLTLYNTDAHTNWIHYAADDPYLKEVRWSELEDGVARVEVWTSPKIPLIGYNVEHEDGALVLTLRWPLPPAAKKKSPLDGATIVIDPGHSPSDPGRIGPLGTFEREHNLRTARVVEKLLKKEGANVVMTRTSPAEVNLQERVDMAWEARADALVSLHNNALPDGVDPFASPHGFSVFYFHPHSRALAESLHRAYVKYIDLHDEGLRFGDLFIPRTTRMPSVLIESAYFIFPEQEQLLLDDGFQAKLGKAIVEGLRNYFRRVRTAPPKAG